MNIYDLVTEEDGMLAIRTLQLSEMEYEIGDGSVTIKLPHLKTRHSRHLTTILGSKGTDITLTRDDVQKLPHEMVHSLITGHQEVMVQGMSPDMTIMGPDGTIKWFLEIVTRETTDVRVIQRAIASKLVKYNELADSVGAKIAVIGVGLGVIDTHNCVLDDNSIDSVLDAYAYGMGIKRAFNQIQLPDVRPWVKPPTDPIKIEIELSSVDLPSISSHMASVKAGSKSIAGSLMKVPLFTHGEASRIPSSIYLRGVWENLNFPGPVDKPDQRDFHLPSSVDQLVMEGVRQKQWLKKCSMVTKDIVKRKNELNKRPLNPDGDVELIRRYIHGGTFSKLSMEDAMEDPELQSFGCLEQVLRECILNMKRSLPDGKVIIRQILGTSTYVAILPTRYHSTHDNPCFYQVLTCGSPMHEGLFDRWNMIGDGWYLSPWRSTDRRRAEHTINLREQIVANQLGATELMGGCPRTGEFVFDSTGRFMALALIADNNSLSVLLQQLRFYYMKVYSGVEDPLEVLEKFPQRLRHPMAVYVMQEVRRLHKQARGHMLKPVDEPEIEEVDYTNTAANDKLSPVTTPFGFDIVDGNTFLLAIYMGNLKNKNEQSSDHDAKTIMTKILKNEALYWEQGPVPILVDEPKLRFQASPAFIARGSRLAFGRILENFTPSQVLQKIRKKLDTNVSQLYSTKSSSSATGETYDRDNYDRRSKVFVELKKSGILGSLSENIHGLLETAEPTVSLFKKNQIGGSREIYIMNFAFRLVVRYAESVARALCECHPDEILTKSANKDGFTKRHNKKVRSVGGHHSYTVNISADMTNWANLLMNDYFKVMIKEIYPPEVAELVIRCLDVHQRKKLYLPKALLESFNNSQGEYSDKNLNDLREAFLGMKELPFADKGRPYITNRTNMMQGILHYTSSLYHICLLETLKEHIETEWTGDNITAVVSYEVSSDDEGIKVSFCGYDDENIRKRVALFTKSYRSIKDTLDRKFGVRTSWSKSTTSVQKIFEFNSKFYFGNTACLPLIKYTARSLDDNPSETLHSRVAAFHSQLRSLRENGASGQLCHLINKLQVICLRRNLGFGVTSNFNERYDEWPALSCLGKLTVMPPELAGLVNQDYANWLACKGSSKAMGIYVATHHLLRAGTTLEGINLSFSMFPKAKYNRCLRELGLARTELSSDDIRIILTPAGKLSQDQQMRLNDLRTLSPGVARSFAWLSRTDTVMAGAYLLNDPIFGGLRLSEIVDNAEPSTARVQDFFPAHGRYLGLEQLCESKREYVKMRKPRAYTKVTYYPTVHMPAHIAEWKNVLNYKWFGDPYLTPDRAERYWDRLSHQFPWLTTDWRVSLSQSPFDSPTDLLAFFESIAEVSKPFSIYSSGGRFTKDPVHSLILQNTYRNHTFVGVRLKEPKIWRSTQLEARIHSWCSLIGDQREKFDVTSDIMAAARQVSLEELEAQTESPVAWRRSISAAVLAKARGHGFEWWMDQQMPGTMYFLKPQALLDGRFVGKGLIFVKCSRSYCLLRVEDDRVLEVIGSPSSQEIKAVCPALNGYDFTTTIRQPRKPDFDSKQVRFCVKRGLRVCWADGYSQAVWGMPSPMEARIPSKGFSGIEKTVVDCWMGNDKSKVAELLTSKSDNRLVKLFQERAKEAFEGRIRIRIQEHMLREPEPKLAIDTGEVSLGDILGMFDLDPGDEPEEDLLDFMFEDDPFGDSFGPRIEEVQINIMRPVMVKAIGEIQDLELVEYGAVASNSVTEDLW